MSSELIELARKLAEGARAKVEEEEKRINAIIARRDAAKTHQQAQPSR